MIKTILQTFSEIIPVTFSVSEYTNHKMEDDPCTLYTYKISEYLIKFKLSRFKFVQKKIHWIECLTTQFHILLNSTYIWRLQSWTLSMEGSDRTLELKKKMSVDQWHVDCRAKNHIWKERELPFKNMKLNPFWKPDILSKVHCKIHVTFKWFSPNTMNKSKILL